MTKLLFDPQIIPVESLAGEAAVRPELLTVDWLRARFANPPDWHPEGANEHLLRQRSTPPTPASVLLPIVARKAGLTLLRSEERRVGKECRL